mmetsp:Transcript_6294/g.8238  ORF Transcript_6294/g.8238 Transcript_6294/m.8238 type:complete len:124 (+) Transcript_6294:136-507(+)
MDIIREQMKHTIMVQKRMKSVTFSSNIHSVHIVECFANLEEKDRQKIWWSAAKIKQNMGNLKAEYMANSTNYEGTPEREIRKVSSPQKLKKNISDRLQSIKGRLRFSPTKNVEDNLCRISCHS